MKNKNTVIEAKIGNLNELTKVLSVKEQAKEQLFVVMKALGIGKIIRNLKFEKIQGYTLTSLFISLLLMRLWGKTKGKKKDYGLTLKQRKEQFKEKRNAKTLGHRGHIQGMPRLSWTGKMSDSEDYAMPNLD